ncbi:tRNA (N6-isopentenyl adenosine(37)-C2)-methylthiotransferase MiaB [Blattabacterium cuenoti]|uniref:tRNA (N6-isopentenyl adenosine(37)-C2)-methylthiotransferase MiaB n=1 Tax=Blattabacterium cuenoti TaxID=1653831 RepID=UPI00163CB3F5|nr:tRNA (N6-isopentenyl adenosine(37)-C2)-methylthiotransferase MiaB [Blattabacterium cuenoti]
MNHIKKIFFYIENYGCQMNISDSEIIIAILLKNQFFLTKNIKKAHIILINTCAVRKKPELILINRLKKIKYLTSNNKIHPIFIVIGCLSKDNSFFLKKVNLIDFNIHPDSYKKLPYFINLYFKNKFPKNIQQINNKENYSDIIPFRKKNKITTFLSITRGCDNMCTFCIVPFTRGRERSRDPYSIIKECKNLYIQGYREITLLGQNVDSYIWNYENNKKIIDFSNLLDFLAKEIPFMRIRFSTSNPHDMSLQVIKIISKHKNICKHIHLPVQSGSNKILKLMNRKYTREKYINLIKKIKSIIPECSISHDIITGFCNEEEEDHKKTISLMNEIKYHYGYMFSYSPRPGTYAYKKLKDNVPLYIKKRRLKEIIDLQKNHSIFHMKKYLGKQQEILIEGVSKKNDQYWFGRNTQNIITVFPKKKYKIGQMVFINIIDYTSATLIGE